MAIGSAETLGALARVMRRRMLARLDSRRGAGMRSLLSVEPGFPAAPEPMQAGFRCARRDLVFLQGGEYAKLMSRAGLHACNCPAGRGTAARAAPMRSPTVSRVRNVITLNSEAA